MFKLKSVLFLCVNFFLYATAAKFPFIEPCDWANKECILTSSNKALPFILNGIPEIGMPSLNPLVLKKVNGDSDALKLSIFNLAINRINECKLNEVSRPDKLKLFLNIDCPLKATGEYSANGTFISIPVFGQGAFGFSTEQMNFKITINMATFEKNGLTYYKFSNLKYTYDPLKKATFHLDNLYNGDVVRAEAILKILDESWKEVLIEFGAPLIKKMITDVINTIGAFIKEIPSNEFELS